MPINKPFANFSCGRVVYIGFDKDEIEEKKTSEKKKKIRKIS